ncbi:PREDICTED: uncharacterized protein LOC104511528, partial [Eurypyga helias]|uniref:uncharacterized protein LOC104511528 n=1 Tax=Eurypyga helias TaxID=54383 RepID=UPI000528E4FC
EPVTFEDIAVYLSRAEWDAIAVGQRDLYRSVMLDNYELLTSLGYPGPKPDVLYRMERGEEPWICTPQSPVRWDGPDSPSAEHSGDVSWLKQRTQSPCQGWCTQWRLRSRRLLNKFKHLEALNESLAEVAGRAGPVESREQAQVAFQPGTEKEVEDKQGVVGNAIQGGGFTLHPVMEQQDKKADPWEHLHGNHRERVKRNALGGRCTLRECLFFQRNMELPVKELNKTVSKDHSYCGTSKRCLWLGNSCPLRDHNYCRDRKAAVLALEDHQYCHVRRQRSARKAVRLTRKTRATLWQLVVRRSYVLRIIRKAKRTILLYKPCPKRLEFPRAPAGTGRPKLTLPATVPPAEARGVPTKPTCGALCPLAEQGTLPPKPQSDSTAQGAMSEALCAPVESLKPVAVPPPWNIAAAGNREATPPTASDHHQARVAQPIRSPDAKQNVEGCKLVNTKCVALHNAYKKVMWSVDHVLDSMRQNLELGGCSRREDAWPVIVRIGR